MFGCDLSGGTTDNNVVRASARLRRAPEYTAPKACSSVTKLGGVERCMAERRLCLARRREPLNVICHASSASGSVQCRTHLGLPF
jgi:hypothetical protein